MYTLRKRLSLSIVLVASLLLSSATLSAQNAAATTSDWSVLKSVTSGSKLVVKLKTGKTVEGKLSSVSDLSMSLAVKGAPVDLKSDDVLSVFEVRKKSATKPTLIGLGVGAGAGAAVGTAAGGNDNGFEKIDHVATAALTVLGAGVGAMSGYLVGRGGSKRVLIYQAK